MRTQAFQERQKEKGKRKKWRGEPLFKLNVVCGLPFALFLLP
jgi:hypothetical protein